MTACEKCWSDAFHLYSAPGETQADRYSYLLHKRREQGKVCTPREQAGEDLDEPKTNQS